MEKKPIEPIERALIIYSEPLEWILEGRKVWELRSRPTKIRGWIALSEKGAKRIVGICRLVDCLGPLTVNEFIENAKKMAYTRAELEEERKQLEEDFNESTTYAWVLEGVKRLPTPISFENPSGAVIWARIPIEIAQKLVKL